MSGNDEDTQGQDLVPVGGGTLAERLAGKLVSQVPIGPAKGVLLLDVSGSMSEYADATFTKTKIAALRDVVKALNPERMFWFSDFTEEMHDKIIPDPMCGTNYSRAFVRMKAEHLSEVVMVTDGIPNDPDDALVAVQGLRLEIVYVGPVPRPEYLDRLAAACGGHVGTFSLGKKTMPQLIQAIRGYLGTGGGIATPPPPNP